MTGPASRAVWDWRERDPAREQARIGERLRREGLVQGLLVLGLGFVVRYVLAHVTMGNILVIVGAVQAVCGMWRPFWLRPVRRVALAFGRAVGLSLGWILLVPVYLLIVTPGALLLRLRGRDPLQRAPLLADLTAWIPRRRASTPASLARQFLEEDREARRLQRSVGADPDPALLAEVAEPLRGEGAGR